MKITLDEETIDACWKVAPFASKDTSRPALVAVWLTEGVVAATDGYSLGWTEGTYDGPPIAIPIATLRSAPSEGRWSAEHEALAFPTSFVSLLNRSKGGAWTGRITYRSEFLSVVTTRQAESRVVLAPSHEGLAALTEDGCRVLRVVEAPATQPSECVALNRAYLTKALRAFDDESCGISLNGTLKPVRIWDDTMTALLMPIRLGRYDTPWTIK